MPFIQLTEMGDSNRIGIRAEDVIFCTEATVDVDGGTIHCVKIRHNSMVNITVTENIHEVLRLLNGGKQ